MRGLQLKILSELLKTYPGIKWESGEDTYGNPCIGVVVDNVWITDPFTSGCGRFVVEPESYGFSNESGQALVKANIDLCCKRLEPMNFEIEWMQTSRKEIVSGSYFTEAKGYTYDELADIASLLLDDHLMSYVTEIHTILRNA